jgi:hypothetical protein
MGPHLRAPVIVLLALVAALGCGKRGDPRPPLRKNPQPLTQFRVAQRGSRLEVSGVAPRVSTEGVALKSMTIELLRSDGDGDFLKLARKRAFSVLAGESFTEPETLPAPGTLVRIAARAIASRKPSALTGIMTLPAQPPPQAPAGLAATVVAGGVELKWTGRRPRPLPTPEPAPPTLPPAEAAAPAAPTTPPPPPSTPTLAPASTPEAAPPAPTTAASQPTPDPLAPPVSRAGFWVYRRAQAGAYSSPLFAEPIAQKSYLDTEAAAGQEWCYVARAVVSTEPLIESDSSNEACLKAVDVAPPAAPAGLTVLARPGGLELRWSPSPESDLQHYRVYRATGTGDPEKLAEIPPGPTVYLDLTAVSGSVYRYTVTAVDRAGNESAPSAPLLGNLP